MRHSPLSIYQCYDSWLLWRGALTATQLIRSIWLHMTVLPSSLSLPPSVYRSWFLPILLFFSHSLLLLTSLCSSSLFYFFIRIVTFSCFLFHSSFPCVFSFTYLIHFSQHLSLLSLFSPNGLSVLSICISIYSGQLCARCGPLSQLLASWRRKEGDGNDLSWKIVRNNSLNRCDKG